MTNNSTKTNNSAMTNIVPTGSNSNCTITATTQQQKQLITIFLIVVTQVINGWYIFVLEIFAFKLLISYFPEFKFFLGLNLSVLN